MAAVKVTAASDARTHNRLRDDTEVPSRRQSFAPCSTPHRAGHHHRFVKFTTALDWWMAVKPEPFTLAVLF